MHFNKNKFSQSLSIPLSFVLSTVFSSILLTGCFDSKNSVSEKKSAQPEAQETTIDRKNKPNVVVFYVDDLGYGDVGSYGATGVKTPNIDELAANGIRFTDAHSSSATCTPSRYSLLTGEYAFRNKASVLQGDAALIIPTNKPTLPKMLKKAGYTTAVVGKWHLGLGDGVTPIDWNSKVSPGPLEIGFDYSFLMPATGDRVPSVYLENHHVVNLQSDDPLAVSYDKKIGLRPTGTENPELLRQIADPQHNNTIVNGISRIGWMQGGQSAEWKDEDFYQIFTNMANYFIEDNKEKPFFLFFSFHDIHVPRLPNDMFKGKSTMGVRGDAIVQMDWITGEVVRKLEEAGVLDNTLIIFTSDNGPVLNDGYEDGAVEMLGDHKPAGVYRGGKYSAFEAGTRVPTIVHYPNKVKTGTSDSLMSQVDIYASVAHLVNVELGNTEAIDSENMMNAWLNAAEKGRTELIEESYTLSLRTDEWKYIAPSNNLNEWIKNSKNIEAGLSKSPQLYNLQNDPAEQSNLADAKPKEVSLFQNKLDKLVNKTTR